MRGLSSNRKTLLAVATVVVAVMIAVVVLWPHVKGPDVVAIEEMPEPPLPSDPRQAELVIRDRYLQDKMAGMDDETCGKRHKARMKRWQEMNEEAHENQ